MTDFTDSRLSRLFAGKREPNAIVVEGSGANVLADRIAAAAVCSANNRPCGSCESCIKAQSGNHPDILVYTPQKKMNPYKIEDIRAIRSAAFILPNEAVCKVFILRNVDGISAACQDALLKILEEPPEYVRFILTCRQKSSLLSTVLSRVTVFYDNSGDECDEHAQQLAEQMASALLLPESLSLLRVCNTLQASHDNALIDSTFDALCAIFRLAYREKLTHTGDKTAIMLAGSMSLQNLLSLINVVSDIKAARTRNANPTLNFTRCCAAMRAAAGR